MNSGDECTPFPPLVPDPLEEHDISVPLDFLAFPVISPGSADSCDSIFRKFLADVRADGMI